MNMNINFHKWDKKTSNHLFKSFREHLDMEEIQFYQPYFSLYFHLHNTKNSHKRIDLKRNSIKNISFNIFRSINQK